MPDCSTGKTWSNRTALDASVKVPGSGWYGSGVGGGTQLPSGRLIILSEERKQYRRPSADCQSDQSGGKSCLATAYNAVPVYSDTAGRTWQRGAFLVRRAVFPFRHPPHRAGGRIGGRAGSGGTTGPRAPWPCCCYAPCTPHVCPVLVAAAGGAQRDDWSGRAVDLTARELLP